VDLLRLLSEPHIYRRRLAVRWLEWQQRGRLRRLTTPRPGKPLPNGASVVFSGHYPCPGLPLNWYHPASADRYLRVYVDLLERGLLNEVQTHVPSALDRRAMQTIHGDDYLDSLENVLEIAGQLDWPALEDLAPEHYRRFLDANLHAAGGTLLAARLALQGGLAINLSGGFHHAKPRYAEGFCLIADVPIAIRVLQEEELLQRVLVVDLDVHQGNGTIVCLEDDERVFTFSMHQEEIYPSPKEQGSLDIGLPSGTDDAEYLELLREALPRALEVARPDLVFLLAGADVLAGDPLASLALTPQGLRERDAWVAGLCRERGLPLVILLAGGYREDAWRAQAESLAGILSAWRPL